MNNETLEYIREQIKNYELSIEEDERRYNELEKEDGSHRQVTAMTNLEERVLRMTAKIDACQDILYNCPSSDAIYYAFWSRDCDMCESSSVGWVHDQEEMDDAEKQAARHAEGPFSFEVITRGQYDEFRADPPRNRDRVMEAYENGNGSNIYV